MAATRSLYWATAMKEIQADRAKRPAGLLAAQGLIAATSRQAPPPRRRR